MRALDIPRRIRPTGRQRHHVINCRRLRVGHLGLTLHRLTAQLADPLVALENHLPRIRHPYCAELTSTPHVLMESAATAPRTERRDRSTKLGAHEVRSALTTGTGRKPPWPRGPQADRCTGGHLSQAPFGLAESERLPHSHRAGRHNLPPSSSTLFRTSRVNGVTGRREGRLQLSPATRTTPYCFVPDRHSTVDAGNPAGSDPRNERLTSPCDQQGTAASDRAATLDGSPARHIEPAADWSWPRRSAGTYSYRSPGMRKPPGPGSWGLPPARELPAECHCG